MFTCAPLKSKHDVRDYKLFLFKWTTNRFSRSLSCLDMVIEGEHQCSPRGPKRTQHAFNTLKLPNQPKTKVQMSELFQATCTMLWFLTKWVSVRTCSRVCLVPYVAPWVRFRGCVWRCVPGTTQNARHPKPQKFNDYGMTYSRVCHFWANQRSRSRMLATVTRGFLLAYYFDRRDRDLKTNPPCVFSSTDNLLNNRS